VAAVKAWLLVALGGGAGSVLRYQVGVLALRCSEFQRFPVATVLVNVLGCLAAGWLWGYSERWGGWSEELRLAVLVGFLGGFTTFSAFGLETFLMVKRGAFGVALTYLLASLVLGVLAVWAGYTLAAGRG
jgi:CrcB protein